MNKKLICESLYSGIWGTIGPRFSEASALLGQRFSSSFCLLTHSNTTAYEAVLRSLSIGRGDFVLCAAYSNKIDAEIPASIGAIPIFIDVEKETFILSPVSIANALNTYSGVKAVVVDYSETMDLTGISEICQKHLCALIVNAGTALDVHCRLDHLYSVIFDLGICGAIVTSEKENYTAIFGYHHCGHEPGTTECFTFGNILGGDMRVSEWQAAEAIEIIQEAHPAKPVLENNYILSCNNPALKTPYFHKLTGFTDEYSADKYPNAKAAADLSSSMNR